MMLAMLVLKIYLAIGIVYSLTMVAVQFAVAGSDQFFAHLKAGWMSTGSGKRYGWRDWYAIPIMSLAPLGWPFIVWSVYSK